MQLSFEFIFPLHFTRCKLCALSAEDFKLARCIMSVVAQEGRAGGKKKKLLTGKRNKNQRQSMIPEPEEPRCNLLKALCTKKVFSPCYENARLFSEGTQLSVCERTLKEKLPLEALVVSVCYNM